MGEGEILEENSQKVENFFYFSSKNILFFLKMFYFPLFFSARVLVCNLSSFSLFGDKEKQRKEKTIMTNAGLKEPNREIKEEEEERRKKKKKKTKKIAVWRLLLRDPLQDLSGQSTGKPIFLKVLSSPVK